MPSTTKTILGIDIGTSGIRVCIVEKQVDTNSSAEKILFTSQTGMPIPCANKDGTITQDSQVWIDILIKLLDSIPKETLSNVTHIICDATSSTVLIMDNQGKPLTHALMYNDNSAKTEAAEIDKIIQQKAIETAASGASSTLAKAINLASELKQRESQRPNNTNTQLLICHQIDLINYFLTGKLGITDENNALKLGFDSVNFEWPNWVKKHTRQMNLQLPKVIKPGEKLGLISNELAKTMGFNPAVQVMAGTTDSIAGFLASGAHKTGDAVSSLGSTLAIKMITKQPVFDNTAGLYSHKLGNNWLVGGASNCGGKIFLDYYLKEQLPILTEYYSESLLSKLLESNTRYYPLSAKNGAKKDDKKNSKNQPAGERFPIADANLKPDLPKEPDKPLDMQNKYSLQSHQTFCFQLGLGLTQVEQLAYEKLQSASNTYLNRVFSVGGGTKNIAWMKLRKELLPAKLIAADHLDAAYGVTKLV